MEESDFQVSPSSFLRKSFYFAVHPRLTKERSRLMKRIYERNMSEAGMNDHIQK